ncbi:MAG TPA: hypothetical protein PKZ76_18950 [Xanthomonadaceae bacterium]|mgnify:CR=1 FL=1|nr:hypothetical protein [Xanthomonadaceae bacterium]
MNIYKKRLLVQSISAAVVLTLVACGGSGDDAAPTPEPPAPPTTLERVQAYLAAEQRLWATEVPSGEQAFAASDSCYLTNGATKEMRIATYNASSAAFRKGFRFENVEILEERQTTNADGSARHEVDVRYDEVFTGGTSTKGIHTTLIAGSSAGTPGCATPTTGEDMRSLGNRRILGAVVQARNISYSYNRLSDGTPQDNPTQLRRELRWNITDPSGVATYVVISGPGRNGDGTPFSMKYISPRMMREAPELQGVVGSATYLDTDSFVRCRSNANDGVANADTADCVGLGGTGTGWGVRLNPPYSAERIAQVDTIFESLGFEAGGQYTIAVYNDDGWKTVNGQAGKTPIATLTALTDRLPYTLAEMTASPAAHPVIAVSSLTPAQLVEGFKTTGGVLDLTWTAAEAPAGAAPMAIASTYTHRQGPKTDAAPWPRVRGSLVQWPAPGALSLELPFEGKPEGASATSYAEYAIQYTDRNNGWIIMNVQYY